MAPVYFYGSLVILICSVGYFYSWKYQLKENYKLSVLLLVLSGLILRLYVSEGFCLHFWDERYHALVAKNLMKHFLSPTLYDNPILPYNHQSWGSNHIWVHKQPLPLWSMALSMMAFGVNEFAVRLPSILLTSIGTWLTFSTASYLFNKKIGYLAAFFYSINGLIIEMAAGRVATDHVDIFFLFFIQLGVFFSVKFVQKENIIYSIFVGISIGAAVLSKWLPAFIVLPIWLLLVIDSQKFSTRAIVLNLMMIVTTAVIIFLPWQIYIYHMYPLEARWEAAFNIKHITEVLNEQGGPVYYYLDKIRINYNDIIYLPLVWFLWKTCKNRKDLQLWAVTIWFVIPFLFFSFLQTKMQGYILFVSPALFMMAADFYYKLKELRSNVKLKWVAGILMLLLVALPIRYSIERIKLFDTKDRNPQWVMDLKALNEKHIEHGVLFNYNKPVEAMFYTDLTAYTTMPSKDMVADLISKNYVVIINNDGKVPADILSIPSVKQEHLTSTEQ